MCACVCVGRRQSGGGGGRRAKVYKENKRNQKDERETEKKLGKQ